MGFLQDLLKEVPLSSVLRERVQLAEDRWRRAEEETETLRLRVSELEKENSALRDSMALRERRSDSAGEAKLDAVTERVLQAVVVAHGVDRDVGEVADRLGLSRAVVEAHLDELKAKGFARMSSSNYISGHIYWSPLPPGRKYALQHGLIG